MRNYQEQLQFQALKDLTNRAKSGILTYITVFLVIAYTYDLPTIAPDFYYINLGALLLILITRASHFFALNVSALRSKFSTPVLHHWLVVSVLIAALHWGLMSGWIIYDDNLNHLRLVALIIIPSFALGGACILCISSEIRILYPALMFAPLIIALIAQGGSEQLMLAGLISFSLIYIFSATYATHDDYWKAITNHMVAEERAELMERLSTTDQLTQLKNRMFFDAEYTREWKRCSRIKAPLSIIMVDLDHFKRINDTFGHMFGDDCLRAVANCIANEVKRPADHAARYGGEEFVVLIPNTDARGTETIAQRILESVSNIQLSANGKPIKLTCSIGGSTIIPKHLDEKPKLIQQADNALYIAKNSGRNCYRSYLEEDQLSRA